MTKHLLQIHIGPVQEFIAAARRSRDLWFGSWLLSELSKAVAKAIADAENDKGVLIFPAPATDDDLLPDETNVDLVLKPLLNVANKVVAVVTSPKAVAKKAEAGLNARLQQMIKETFSEGLLARIDEKTAVSQIENLTEFYWVSVPLPDGGYVQARKLADSLLAARKNTRNFSAVTWGSNRPKSSLDGARESVIPRNDVKNTTTMYKRYRAKAGEQLSGVDLLKRLGNPSKAAHFPSTSHMAAIPLAAQLEEKWQSTHWQAYLKTLPNEVKQQEIVLHDLELPKLGKADGSLLYESRLLDYFDRPSQGKNQALENARQALSTFFRETEIEPPGRYYALLMGDGDFMGEVIDNQLDESAHRDFSRALAGFATEAKKIVGSNAYKGAVIYAGGDDVMALLPLHTAVSCAKAVADKFAALMSGYTNKNGNPPTFSAGLAIVHHLEPLEDALNLARVAEKKAKGVKGANGEADKNALAIVLDKRSGASRTIVGKWVTIVDRLLNFAAMHQQEMIPDRLAYQLRHVYLSLGGMDALTKKEEETDAEKEVRQKLRTVVGLEASRIIGRKREADGKGKLADEVKAYIETAVSPPLLSPSTEQEPELHIEAIATELMIAAEISKSCTLAGKMLLLNIKKDTKIVKEGDA